MLHSGRQRDPFVATLLCLLCLAVAVGCNSPQADAEPMDAAAEPQRYFPPIAGEWASATPEGVSWSSEGIEDVLLGKGTGFRSADPRDDLRQEKIAGVGVREPVPRAEVELLLPGEEIDELSRRIAESASLGLPDQLDQGEVLADSAGVM